MSDFFCECKDSDEPPCAGLEQLRTDLAAAQEALAKAEARAEGYRKALANIYNTELGYPYAGNTCGEIAREALGGRAAARAAARAAIAEGKS